MKAVYVRNGEEWYYRICTCRTVLFDETGFLIYVTISQINSPSHPSYIITVQPPSPSYTITIGTTIHMIIVMTMIITSLRWREDPVRANASFILNHENTKTRNTQKILLLR